jgi:signal transduction histidine kinase
MLEKLMPRSDDFFDDFEKQAAATVEGVQLFKALLEDFTDVPTKVKAIKDVEHRADDITHRAFERLHGAQQYPGTGIGLAIVQKGATRLGGAAGVDSDPGVGSRFWVELGEAEGPAA